LGSLDGQALAAEKSTADATLSWSKCFNANRKETCMLIQVGYELVFNCPQTTPMILMVNVHYSRASDIVVRDPSLREIIVH
jgi:hypothetical protein